MERFTQHRAAPAEPSLQVFVTEDRNSGKSRLRRRVRRGLCVCGLRRGRLGLAVGIVEVPPQPNACAHELEEVDSDDAEPDLLGSAIIAKDGPAPGENTTHILERVLGSVAEIKVLRI